MKYQAIMFDLDGTLADSLADIAAAANFALAQLGRPVIALDRYRYLVGQGVESLMTQALGRDHLPLLGRAIALFHSYYSVHSLDQTCLYPGVPELLDELAGRRLTVAILSNKPDPATQTMVGKILGRWNFSVVRGHVPPAPLKPDPAAALGIATELDIPAHRWVYLGDTRVDMLAAVAAGFLAVGVLWGFRDEPELRAAGAKAILRRPCDALGLLND